MVYIMCVSQICDVWGVCVMYSGCVLTIVCAIYEFSVVCVCVCMFLVNVDWGIVCVTSIYVLCAW